MPGKKPQEWLDQAEYDLETAEYMLEGERFFYAVFMCHLAIEKALKGLTVDKTGDEPPRTHNLVFLLDKAGIEPADTLLETIFVLNRVSVPTRYPESLKKLLADYDRKKTTDLVRNSQEVLRWLKTQL